MTITPSGRPAFERANDFTTYGGHPLKQNHMGQGVIDALTDVGAEGFNRLTADVAAAQLTAPFAELQVLCNDTVPAAPTVEYYVSMATGIRTVSYAGDAPPTGLPTAVRNGNGDVSITWPTTYADPFSISGALRIRAPMANAVGSALVIAVPEQVSDSVIRVRCRNVAGSAVSNARFVLEVHSG